MEKASQSKRKQRNDSQIQQQVYLVYSENQPWGTEPRAVSIFAAKKPILNMTDNLRREYIAVLPTDKTPRSVLESLESAIYKESGVRPTFRDSLPGTSQDNKPINDKSIRHLDYIAVGSWPKKGQTEAEAKMKAEEYNNQRNMKLFKVFYLFTENFKG